MTKKIVVMNPGFTEDHYQRIREAATVHGYEIYFFSTPEEAARQAADAEILFGQNDAFFSSGKEARWICATSAGVNTFLKEGVIARESLCNMWWTGTEDIEFASGYKQM